MKLQGWFSRTDLSLKVARLAFSSFLKIEGSLKFCCFQDSDIEGNLEFQDFWPLSTSFYRDSNLLIFIMNLILESIRLSWRIS